MRAQASERTGPERAVERALLALGHRPSAQVEGLPGKPDFVVARTAIFVHGCFWHACARCGARRIGGPNAAAWRENFERNRARDARKSAELRALGWRVAVVWEHETKELGKLRARLRSLLG